VTGGPIVQSVQVRCNNVIVVGARLKCQSRTLSLGSRLSHSRIVQFICAELIHYSNSSLSIKTINDLELSSCCQMKNLCWLNGANLCWCTFGMLVVFVTPMTFWVAFYLVVKTQNLAHWRCIRFPSNSWNVC